MELEENLNIRDYKIIERIGFGAHGLVYKTIKKENNKIFVIKQIPLFKKNINKEAKNEALILKKLDCKYIVKYYESFEENNYFNIVMEYCEKGDLSSLLYKLKKNNKFLKENQIWSFFIQICIGLSYIHYKKILHRDLKTQNIFLTKNLNIKIGDLGIAKILQENNHANTLIGTPFYLSPEICEEKPYNEKSDVWALGCILYELITFKHPYNASNQAALLLKIINENYENFSNNIKISDNLKNIVHLLLEKNYIKRPSMIELINNKIIIEKSKELGFYQNLINIHTLYYIKEDKIIKKKQIKKINNLRENRKLSSYFLNISNRNNYLRNKHLNSIENICSSRKEYSSFHQSTFSTSNIKNEKKKRTASIEYMSSPINGKKIPIKHQIKSKYIENKHLRDLSKLNGSNISFKKISSTNENKSKIKNITPSIKKITKCNSFRVKNNRINTSNMNKYFIKKPIFKKILDKFELNKKKINLKLNSSKTNRQIVNKERRKSEIDKKGRLKQRKIYDYNNNKENNDKSYILLKKKIENDSFEIIEPDEEKKIKLDSLSDNEDNYMKKRSISEIKDDSDFEDEKVFIIKNNNFKERKEKLIKEKYEELKKRIYNYQNQIDCDKLIKIFNGIDKNLNNNKMDEMIIKINNYMKLHLPKNIIPQFKKIFNQFCFYGLQLKYSKIES